MRVTNGPQLPQNYAWLVVYEKMWMWGKWGPISQPTREVFPDNFCTNYKKKSYKKNNHARNKNLSSKICAPISSISLYKFFLANINTDDQGLRSSFTPHRWWSPITELPLLTIIFFHDAKNEKCLITLFFDNFRDFLRP